MFRKRSLPVVAMLTALVLLAAACGQKAGVAVGAGGGGGSGGDSEAGFEEFAEGEAVDPGTEPGIDGGGDVGGTSGGSAGGTGGAAAGGTAGGSTVRRGGTTGGDTTTGGGGGGSPVTRVWGKTIMLGIHAPITGAAPLPSTFQRAANDIKAYFNANANLPDGRTIDIAIVDDEYQPATATARCRELVQQRNSFLLIGAAGTDQIQACARYAATVGVPYLSAGVTENGLTTLKNYFAISMSYKAQGAYLANFMKKQFPDRTNDPKRVYMVYSDTPNFRDAVAGFTNAFPGVTLKKLGRTPSSSELNNAANDICSGADSARIAYPLMAPKDWLILVGAQPSGCDLQWSGVGVTMGVNEVAGTGCSQPATRDKFNGSTFFSPYPGVDRAPQLDPEMAKATAGKAWDDIYVALWNVVKTTLELLRRTGPQLSRSAFVQSTENAKNVATGLNPPLNFSPTDHFGADEVHVLKANCNAQGGAKYETLAAFARY